MKSVCDALHIRPSANSTHTHSTVLISNLQKKCAGIHHYKMDHNSPKAFQFHSRQGQPATQSHPSPTLIITLGLLQGKADSLVRRLWPGKSFTGPKVFVIQSLFKPVFSCQHKKSTATDCQSRCVSLSLHVKGLAVSTHQKSMCQISLWFEVVHDSCSSCKL